MSTNFTDSDPDRMDRLIGAVGELRTTLRIGVAVTGIGFSLIVGLLTFLVAQSFSTSSRVDQSNDPIATTRNEPFQPSGPMIPAPGPSLKGKRVVLLTHVVPGTGADYYDDLARDLARELTTLLRKKVDVITVVDPDKVAEWASAHPSWTDPSEAAKALEADMAIFLDVSKFEVEDPRSPGLMEGKSNIHIQVWEIAHPKDSKGKEIKSQPIESNKIYDEQVDTTFPIRGPISRDMGISPSSFRTRFLKLVAIELSWHFVDHPPGDDIHDFVFTN